MNFSHTIMELFLLSLFKAHHKWFAQQARREAKCYVSFCSKEKIIVHLLDVRTFKNKGQYSGFKYHNNKEGKELECIKILGHLSKKSKSEKSECEYEDLN